MSQILRPDAVIEVSGWNQTSVSTYNDNSDSTYGYETASSNRLGLGFPEPALPPSSFVGTINVRLSKLSDNQTVVVKTLQGIAVIDTRTITLTAAWPSFATHSFSVTFSDFSDIRVYLEDATADVACSDVWVELSDGNSNTQTLVPINDINTGWSCSTGTARYGCIDEIPYSDSDYIKTTNNGAMQECKLSAGVDPGVHTYHIAKIRARVSSIPGLTVKLALVQGSTVIKSTSISLTTSFAGYTMTLTESEAANITDYSDLRFRFTTGSGWETRVSQAYLLIPEAANGPGLELGVMF